MSNEPNHDMTAVENALLKNNEYLIDKLTKIVKDEVSTVRYDVVTHNESVLKQTIELSKLAGSNTARLESLERAIGVQEEKLKGLNGKIATVGAVGAATGGFLTFLINSIRG